MEPSSDLKGHTKFALITIVAVLVVIASIAGYRAYILEKERINNARFVSQSFYTELLTLRDYLELVVLKTRGNSSKDELIFVLAGVRDRARSLSKIYWLLYTYTGDDDHYKMSVALGSISDFANTLLNTPPSEFLSSVKERANTFEELAQALEEATEKCRGALDCVPPEIPDKILELLKS